MLREDFNAGLRASQAMARVVEALRLEVGFKRTLWRFDGLAEPAFLEQAAEEAASGESLLPELVCAEGLRARGLGRQGQPDKGLVPAIRRTILPGVQSYECKTAPCPRCTGQLKRGHRRILAEELR